jgi:hypothetical protein
VKIRVLIITAQGEELMTLYDAERIMKQETRFKNQLEEITNVG